MNKYKNKSKDELIKLLEEKDRKLSESNRLLRKYQRTLKNIEDGNDNFLHNSSYISIHQRSINYILILSVLYPNELILFNVLYIMMDKRNVIHATQEELSELLGITRQTVGKRMKTLERLGFVREVKGKGSIWQINMQIAVNGHRQEILKSDMNIVIDELTIPRFNDIIQNEFEYKDKIMKFSTPYNEIKGKK